MALLNLEDDPWLLEYESCEKLQRDIMEQLNARRKQPKDSEMYSKLSANIRLRLKQNNNEVEQLDEKLKVILNSRTITLEETERRRRQVELLKSKSLEMDRMFNEVSSALRKDRAILMGASDWDDDLLDAQPSNSSENYQDMKQRMMRDQEQGLDNLSKIIARQKNIAHTITSEVDLQNEIIDDLGDHIERTDARIHNETGNVRTVDRKDNTCAYWVIIILLFISIIVVIAI